MKKVDTLVIIPNWNGLSLLKENIAFVKNQSQPHDLLIVDNHSTDGSNDYLNGQSNIIVIRHDKNMGFAGGVNAGIRYGIEQNYKYIALLNNDARPDKNWLKYLYQALEKDPQTGVACPLMLDNKSGIDSTGEEYSIWGLPFSHRRNQKYNQDIKSEEVTAASAGAALYRKTVFEEVGLFDENFFAYYEDVDLSLRARHAGWNITFEVRSIVHHKINATSNRLKNFRQFHTTKNAYFLYIKNMPTRLFWRYIFRFKIAMLYRFGAAVRYGWLGPWCKAMFLVLAKTPTLLIQRRKILASSKLSASNFDQLLYHKLPPSEKTMLKHFGWLDEE